MAISLTRRRWVSRSLKRERAERSRPKRRRRFLFPVLELGLCLVGLGLLHVWVRLQVVHLGYVLSATTKLNNQLEQEGRELRVELATLTSRERLMEMARARLGLREPEKEQLVILP